MAEIRSMYKSSILFTLIACHAILSAEGRQIKSMNKKAANSGIGEKAKQGSRSNSLLQNTQGMKELLPPTMSFGDSETSYEDYFFPSSPGNRPGIIGHSFAQEQENVESKLVGDNSQKAGYFKTGVKDDFRPTVPGHSPGVGHKMQN